jgi:Cu-Zn family superoxide dismutase
MSMRKWWSLALGVALIASPAAQAFAAGEKAAADIKDASGKDLGKVEVLTARGGALIKLKLQGLPPGPHAIHFHEMGTCEGDFTSAGAIHNPLGAQHGFLNEDGPMAGDLPNIFVNASGEVEAELLSPFVTLSPDMEEQLLDADGTSIVIFEKADDYLTDPEGEAGTRIACGKLGPIK